jgi:hypothetical protein
VEAEAEAEAEPELVEETLTDARMGACSDNGSVAGCGLHNDSDKKREEAAAGKAAWKKIRNQKRKRKYKDSRRCVPRIAAVTS